MKAEKREKVSIKVYKKGVSIATPHFGRVSVRPPPFFARPPPLRSHHQSNYGDGVLGINRRALAVLPPVFIYLILVDFHSLSHSLLQFDLVLQHTSFH